MNFKENINLTLKDLSPVLEHTSKKEKIWMAFLGVIILWGCYALYIQITQGHIVTGMRDNVVWGIFIVNFIFLIGIGYSGSVIAALLYLFKMKWRFPIIRIAMLMTLFATITGPLFILLCIGRLDRLHHLFLYARLQSPITWDVIAVITYLVGSLIFLYVALIRDFAVYGQSKDLKVSDGRKKWYKRLSFGFKNLPSQEKHLKISRDIIAIMIIPIAIMVSSILSWIFGMTLRPGWHSTIFGPYFVLAAIYSGLGVIVILMYILRKIYSLEKYIKKEHFIYMGYGIMIFGAGYGYFTFSEYFTDWYTSKAWEAELIHKLFSWDHYGYWTLFANLGGILLPLLIIGIPKLRTIGSITLVSLIMVVAMWIKRYLIVIPTLENTLIPMQDLREEYVHYSATWVEWVLVAAGFALFGLLFTLAIKFVTIIPVWQTALMNTEEQNKNIEKS